MTRHIIENTADLLEAAAKELEANGWTKYKLQSSEGELCLSGAIRQAAVGHCYGPLLQREIYEIQSAMLAIKRELPMGYTPVWWNDNVCRSAIQAIEILKNTAKTLREDGEID